MDAKAAKQLVEKENLEFVDVKFSDLFGQWQHLTLPASYMKFVEGEVVPFDGSSIRGFKEINESDMYLHADYSTAVIDPFSSSSISVICDVYDPHHKKYYDRDPRVIAKRAEEFLKSSGAGDVAYFGPEAEFFIFDDLRFSQNEYSGFYSIDSEEGIWNSGGNDGPSLAYRPRYKEGYFPTPPHDSVHEIRNEMVRECIKCGITIERHHHEVATAGQCEINFRFDSLKRSADQMMMYKYLVKNVAKKHGKVATFMPKPLFNDNGSGMHCHQSIWKDGKNTFAGDGFGGLSQNALYYVGGLLKHARSLAAILSPTTNSYKRLVPGFEAPVNLVYSLANRSAAVRIPLVDKENTAAKRVEFRPPDPAANPYLAFSAMLMAGLDGIKHKIDPGESVTENIYHLPKERLDKIKKLPGTLEEALGELEADHQYLLEGGVFTKDLIETWIDFKRHKEIDQVRLRPHPWEFHLYHDV
ncbi:type I glutamate--ammonia ligase [Candidatus Micrarchaeota archaeon]|nr:type I glutamate--ammonia ligase [Candidatus Micrarchaeota archaeon]